MGNCSPRPSTEQPAEKEPIEDVPFLDSYRIFSGNVRNIKKIDSQVWHRRGSTETDCSEKEHGIRRDGQQLLF